MAEAQLRIKPTLTRDYRGGLNKLKQDVNALASRQRTSLRTAVTDVRNLERGYYAAGRAARSVASGSAQLARSLTSIRGIVTGLVAGGAGKTFIEATIGSTLEVNRSRALLRAVIKDQQKVIQVEQAAKELTREVSSLDFNSSLGGMQKLYNLSGQNIARTKQLVTVAKALEGLSPEQGFEGAVFALKELESGDTMSLRSRFNIRLPTRNEAESQAKKANKTLSDFYFDKVIGHIDKTYGDANNQGSGVSELLRIDREGFSGQVRMIQTSVSDLFRSMGTDAADVAGKEIVGLRKEIEKLQTDPQFKEDVKEVTQALTQATKSAFQLAKALPAGLKSAKEFATQYSTELKLLAGLFVTNKLTGGAIGRAGAGAISAGGRKLGSSLFATFGAAGAKGKAGAFMGAQPVYVVNQGGGPGDFLGRNTKSLGGAAAGGGIAKFSAAGLAGVTGAGLLAGGTAVGAAATFYSVVNRTNQVTKKYEDRAKEAQKRAEALDKARARVNRERAQAVGVRNRAERADPTLRNRRLLSSRIQGIGTYAGLGRGSELRASVNQLFGGEDQRFVGSKAQTFMLAELNKELARSGQRLDIRKGQTIGQARMVGGIDVLRKSSSEVDRKAQAVLDMENAIFKRDPSGKLTFRNQAAKTKFEELEKSGKVKQIRATADALRRRGQQAEDTADAFNQSSGRNVNLPKLAEKFEFHFHGDSTTTTAQADAAAKTLNEKVGAAMSALFKEQAANTGG